MALRENYTVTTPETGTKVELRGYITGRIKQEVESVFLSGADMSTGKSGSQELKFNAAVTTQATNRAIELIVLSVNGSATNILGDVLDLPSEDYDFIVAEVNKVQNPLVPSTDGN